MAVDDRALLQLGLEPAALGHVAHRQHDAGDVGVLEPVGHAQVGVHGMAVAVAQRELAGGRVGHPVGGGEQVGEPRPVAGVDQLPDVAAAERGRRVAEQRLDRVGGERDRAVGVDHHDGVGRVLDERPEAAVGLDQPGALALGARGRGAQPVGGAAHAGERDQQQPGDQQGERAGPEAEPPRVRAAAVGCLLAAVDFDVQQPVELRQLAVDLDALAGEALEIAAAPDRGHAGAQQRRPVTARDGARELASAPGGR